MVNWSEVCTSQEKRPVAQLQAANFGSGVFAVGLQLHTLPAHHMPHITVPSPRHAAPLTPVFTLLLQAVSFAAAALYSATWLLRWLRSSKENKMWPHLGWFCGLMFVGSVAGVVTWAAKLSSEVFYLAGEAPSASRREYYSGLAVSLRWYAVFYFMYGVEFMCLVGPKLLLLSRLLSSELRTSQVQVPTDFDSVSRRSHHIVRVLPIVHRVFAFAVAACSITGMVAYAAAGVYSAQTVAMYHQAATECDSLGNDTNSSRAINQQLFSIFVKVNTSQSVQNFTEAIALLLITFTYMLVVPSSVAIFRHAERLAARVIAFAADRTGRHAADALGDIAMMIGVTKQAAAEQRRRLVLACVVVLVTFPARAAFDLMQAYGSFDAPYNADCEHCGPCQSDQWLVWTWLNYTPEFQPIVVAISSPLPLIVSLWLITAAHARALAIAEDVHTLTIASVRQ